MPDVAIKLIDRPTEKPRVPVADRAIVPAAIANAIHNATGARLRPAPRPRKCKPAQVDSRNLTAAHPR
jgi:CO/xanthine dehydrogenase Mo-binding subunit